MMAGDLVVTFLDSLNETLAAAIVVVSVSMLLYNITRNWRNRVARASGAVLACVTVSYLVDVFISLHPSIEAIAIAQRLQWLGIAFIPAALFHLSDALLATTGLPSRGRRRRVLRLLYLISACFLLLALFTDVLVYPAPVYVDAARASVPDGYTSLRAAPIFWVYLAHFLIATAIGLFNVNRARQRCQTRSTKRRMAYLQFAMITPVLGIFPFSVLLPPGEEFSLLAVALVNLTNIVVILMLLFLSYPLSFFGSVLPQRVVKADLLRFLLRGPVTGLIILGVIIFTRRATEILSLPGEAFMPFAVVAVVLFWQWMVDLSLPTLDKYLIYSDEDDDQLKKIEKLSNHLLTRQDLIQLLEGIIAGACDYLNVNNGLVVALHNGEPELMHKTGNGAMTIALIQQEEAALRALFAQGTLRPQLWGAYWVFGLYSRRITENGDGQAALIGALMLEATSDEDPLMADADRLLGKLVARAAQTLDDLLLQSEIYAALEGLLPQIATTRYTVSEADFKPGYLQQGQPVGNAKPLPARAQVIDQVQAALRHYYGGPGLAQSRLQEWAIVRQALADYDNNPTKTLRALLDKAIENQRPTGEPSLRSQEWLLYNILELRFIKKRKVREIAVQLYMSEANLYRKQNLAIEAVADTLIQMELEALSRPDDA